MSAATVVHDVTVGDYTDAETVRAFAAGCDVITFDHEHVPTGLLRDLESAGVVGPPGPDGPGARPGQGDHAGSADRARRPCPVNRVVHRRGGADRVRRRARLAGDRQDLPRRLRRQGGLEARGLGRRGRMPFAGLGRRACRSIAEEFVDFARELSALVVRSPSGQAAAYPISESVQRNGICVETVTPAPGLTDDQAVEAQQLALTIAHELGVVGRAGRRADAAAGRVGGGQRAGHAPAQHRPLDDRRRAHLAVREPPAGGARPAARRPRPARRRGR